MSTFSRTKRIQLRSADVFRLNPARQAISSPIGFLLIATVVGYTFGYLYLMFMGRALGPEAFGIFGSLAAIFYLACLVGQALREAIARNVAEIRATAGEGAAVSSYVRQWAKLTVWCSAPISIVVVSSPIASFFHLDSPSPVLWLAFSLSTALMLDVLMGLLQGLQRFKLLGILGFLVSQGLKLAFGLIFIWVGWDIAGAIAALLASTAIATMIGLVIVWQEWGGSVREQARHHFEIGPLVVHTLLLAVFMAVPASVDVMLVTHFIGGTEAGLYNAVATLGKVIIFLPMGISFVLLPRVTENHVLGFASRRILVSGLLYTALLSGGVALAYLALPGTIVQFFFGQAYAEASGLIGLYGIAMVLFSLNFVIVHYALATRKTGLILLADLATLGQVMAIAFIHDSASQVVMVLLLGNLVGLLSTTLWLTAWSAPRWMGKAT